jgi:transposase-like protein
MAVRPTVTDAEGFGKELVTASPDLVGSMVKAFAEALMSADADGLCNAAYGEVSPDRVNSRNGYRAREWDTRAGTIELAIPKLRQGSYFPEWLLTRRRRAEQALISVVATSYLLGVSTRRVDKLVEQLGVAHISKSQVSELAKHLDAQVEAFRSRPLDAGPYRFVQADALTMKVREEGRVINVHCLLAVGVNGDGHREILGLDVVSSEDGAGWLAFFRGLVARGLSGVRLVTSDAHRGLVAAIGSTLPGTAWQRCRAHWTCVGTTWWFVRSGSMTCYGDHGGCSGSVVASVRGGTAALGRAAAAAGAGGRGPHAGTWGRARGGSGRRGQRDHGPRRCVRAGSGRRAAVGRACPPAGWGP